MKAKHRAGFTLVEVLVSITILTGIMLIVTEVISAAQRSWKLASARVGQFRESRLAFDTVTKNLRQAAIYAYHDFNWDSGIAANPLAMPGNPAIQADLSFFIGASETLFPAGGRNGAAWSAASNGVVFQLPAGYTQLPQYKPLKGLLNARGYTVQLSNDQDFVPQGLRSQLAPKVRFRLVEFRPTTETNTLYTAPGIADWDPTTPLGAAAGGGGAFVPLADNIIGFAVTPGWMAPGVTGVAAFGGETEMMFEEYRSSGGVGAFVHEVPRVVRVTMVAIDEPSASRLALDNAGRSPDLILQSGANLRDPSPASFRRQLERVSTYLASRSVNFRIFSELVEMPTADR
jgi:uncharacterized protein (TIGR02599 family)